MIGIIILIIIGKKFYELAGEYDKSQWGIAVLGIVSYYLGAFVFGIILAIIMIIMESNWMETADRFSLALIELPFGGLSCYLLYMFLHKKWEKEKPQLDNIIEEIGNKE
ncbi:conserved hypothetical protein [Tenacibaculum sp. 190524A05c]|uniref:hypothetical protein n=1 Tax=Tenacibaculum platacis TaxID=3137852 RepID=UPI0031FA6648